MFFIISLIFCENIQSSEKVKTFTPCNEVTINIGKAKLFCRTMGKGEPLLVIHGGPGLSQDYLLPKMEKLAENNFVIFYDQRGCGKSTSIIDKESINIINFVADVETIRKYFGFEKISILAHSWGSFVAMKYAIAYPLFVDKLILSNSIPASSEELALFHKEWNRRMSPYLEEIEKMQSSEELARGDVDTVENYYHIIVRTYCYLAEKANLLNVKMEPHAFINGTKVYSIFDENLFSHSFNLHEALKEVKIPVLVIHGDTDPIPSYAAQHIYESLPNAKYILMQKCGHFPYVEDPEAYFHYIKEFLREETK